eukprot:2872223-Rhodomonas_salina.4
MVWDADASVFELVGCDGQMVCEVVPTLGCCLQPVCARVPGVLLAEMGTAKREHEKWRAAASTLN